MYAWGRNGHIVSRDYSHYSEMGQGMGIGKKAALAAVVLAVIGGISKQFAGKPQLLPPATQTEGEQAVEQCTAALWRGYGPGAVSGPGSDKWRIKKTGGYAALYTVTGKNAFGMPVLNTLECEISKDPKGEWRLPSFWNVTMHDDRLDPNSLDERPAKRSNPKAAPKASETPEVRYDENGTEVVTAEGQKR